MKKIKKIIIIVIVILAIAVTGLMNYNQNAVLESGNYKVLEVFGNSKDVGVIGIEYDTKQVKYISLKNAKISTTTLEGNTLIYKRIGNIVFNHESIDMLDTAK